MELTSPLTGVAQSGLTTPTYTLVSAVAPSMNGKQYNVSALGGIQPGVVPHSVGRPFTLTLFAPSPVKMVPQTQFGNAPMGNQNSWPKNTNKIIVRKSVKTTPDAMAVAVCTLSMDIPAGSPDSDLENLKAMMSAMLGLYIQDPDQWWEAFLSGSL